MSQAAIPTPRVTGVTRKGIPLQDTRGSLTVGFTVIRMSICIIYWFIKNILSRKTDIRVVLTTEEDAVGEQIVRHHSVSRIRSEEVG